MKRRVALVAAAAGVLAATLAVVDLPPDRSRPLPEDAPAAPIRAPRLAEPEGTAHPPVAPAASQTESSATASDPYDERRPLSERLVELDAAARRGEARAACTMGWMLQRCESTNRSSVEMRMQAAEGRLLQLESGADDSPKDAAERQRLLRNQNALQATLDACDAVDIARWEPAPRYFRYAADAGHTGSMLRFLWPHSYTTAMLFRHPELGTEYRDRAPRYVQTLLESGNVVLLQQLRQALLRHEDSMLIAALPPPYGERGFLTALVQRHNRTLGYVETAPLGVAPTSEQTRQAEALYGRYYDTPMARDAARVQVRQIDPYACE